MFPEMERSQVQSQDRSHGTDTPNILSRETTFLMGILKKCLPVEKVPIEQIHTPNSIPGRTEQPPSTEGVLRHSAPSMVPSTEGEFRHSVMPAVLSTEGVFCHSVTSAVPSLEEGSPMIVPASPRRQNLQKLRFLEQWLQ